MKHFVAKLVKSFGGLDDATESLDDFRYTNSATQKACFLPNTTRKLVIPDFLLAATILNRVARKVASRKCLGLIPEVKGYRTRQKSIRIEILFAD